MCQGWKSDCPINGREQHEHVVILRTIHENVREPELNSDFQDWIYRFIADGSKCILGHG